MTYTQRAKDWLEKGGVDPEKTIGENIWAFAAELDRQDRLKMSVVDLDTPKPAEQECACLCHKYNGIVTEVFGGAKAHFPESCHCRTKLQEQGERVEDGYTASAEEIEQARREAYRKGEVAGMRWVQDQLEMVSHTSGVANDVRYKIVDRLEALDK